MSVTRAQVECCNFKYELESLTGDGSRPYDHCFLDRHS